MPPKTAAPSGPSVLVVEDDPEYREIVRGCLRREGFEVTAVRDARTAVRRLHNAPFDAVVSDMRLPGMSGADLLRYVRLHRHDLAFLLLTGVDDVPTAVRSMQDGADEYLLKPVLPQNLTDRVLAAIEGRAVITARERREKTADFAGLVAFMRGVYALVNSLEMKDQYTRDHSRKVALISGTMARALPGMDRRTLREIRVGALLHDVGKIGVPQEILHKNGPLDPDEWEIVKQHPDYGARILQPLAKSYPEVLRIVRHEHERWDGHGYPDGLAGEEIPLGSRLIMVADTYDAICSTRPYRKALGKADALKVIREGAGSQFDPGLVPVFESVLPDLPAPRD